MGTEKITLLAPGHAVSLAEPPASWVGEPISALLRHYDIDFSKHLIKVNNTTVTDPNTPVAAGATVTVSKGVTNG